MLLEDNNGFINFPNAGEIFNREDSKTLVYIVAFDANYLNKKYILSNVSLLLRTKYVIDDVTGSVYDLSFSEEIEGDYFIDSYIDNGLEILKSIPMVSSVCVGWNDHSFSLREGGRPWYATFRDLTNEGRKLYYSMKKLHNNKEVRILTINLFNNE
jgi:hypothetical protein